MSGSLAPFASNWSRASAASMSPSRASEASVAACGALAAPCANCSPVLWRRRRRPSAGAGALGSGPDNLSLIVGLQLQRPNRSGALASGSPKRRWRTRADMPSSGASSQACGSCGGGLLCSLAAAQSARAPGLLLLVLVPTWAPTWAPTWGAPLLVSCIFLARLLWARSQTSVQLCEPSSWTSCIGIVASRLVRCVPYACACGGARAGACA